MKAEKLIKLLGLCSCCVLLSGCTGVSARVQNTETVLEETELPGSEGTEESEMEPDVEDATVEVTTGNEHEEEQVLDQSAEIQTAEAAPVAEVTASETEGVEESETESETESEENKILRKLEYQVEDQELETGKCFGEIVVPEFATAEDGSRVTGKVEWRRPGKDRVFENDMALTGLDGDKRTWEWTFVPDEEGYETVTGTVEITMREAVSEEEEGEMAKIADLWSEKVTDETSKGSSASGSSAGASNIIEASDIAEAAKWMGSHMTGAGLIGDEKESSAREAGKENFTVAHGTVKREETEAPNEVESGLFETEKEKAASALDTGKAAETKATSYRASASPLAALEYVMNRNKAGSLKEKNDTGEALADRSQRTSDLTCEEVLEYGNIGVTVFAAVNIMTENAASI